MMLRFHLLLFLALIVLPKSVLAADATSFDPSSVTINSQSTIAVGTVIAWPAGSNPSDMPKWLECNGQVVPGGALYDRLRLVLGSNNVPNYNDQFLRGTGVAGQVGQQVSDTIASHSVLIPGQVAPVSGSLASTAITGSASSQQFNWSGNVGFNYQATTSSQSLVVGAAQNHILTWTSYNNDNYTARGSTDNFTVSGWTGGGSIYGSLANGSVSGFASVAAQTGNYTGGSETAPRHVKVRYLIRAIQ